MSLRRLVNSEEASPSESIRLRSLPSINSSSSPEVSQLENPSLPFANAGARKQETSARARSADGLIALF